MNQDQFTRLYETYNDRLVHHLRRRQIPDAEAVAHDVWVRVLQAKFPTHAKGWVWKIAKNVICDATKHASRQKRGGGWTRDYRHDPIDRSPPPGARIERADEMRQARERMAELPRTQQTILQSVYLEGRTLTGAAAHLRLPIGTIKTRLHGALKTLRAAEA